MFTHACIHFGSRRALPEGISLSLKGLVRFQKEPGCPWVLVLPQKGLSGFLKSTQGR